MKILNRKGSALLQVLVLSTIIATIVIVLLKFSITRTSNTIQTKHIINAKMAMQSCMSQLNSEELRRVQLGQPSYFEVNETFPCNVADYAVTIKRGSGSHAFSHSDGIVRPLEFSITLYSPGNLGPVEEEAQTTT